MNNNTCNLLSNVYSVQECDATKADSSNIAGCIKVGKLIAVNLTVNNIVF
jgi:hypothetical protein